MKIALCCLYRPPFIVNCKEQFVAYGVFNSMYTGIGNCIVDGITISIKLAAEISVLVL